MQIDAEFVLQSSKCVSLDFTDELFDSLQLLWMDVGVLRTFKRHTEFQIADSAQ